MHEPASRVRTFHKLFSLAVWFYYLIAFRPPWLPWKVYSPLQEILQPPHLPLLMRKLGSLGTVKGLLDLQNGETIGGINNFQLPYELNLRHRSSSLRLKKNTKVLKRSKRLVIHKGRIYLLCYINSSIDYETWIRSTNCQNIDHNSMDLTNFVLKKKKEKRSINFLNPRCLSKYKQNRINYKISTIPGSFSIDFFFFFWKLNQFSIFWPHHFEEKLQFRFDIIPFPKKKKEKDDHLNIYLPKKFRWCTLSEPKFRIPIHNWGP